MSIPRSSSSSAASDFPLLGARALPTFSSSSSPSSSSAAEAEQLFLQLTNRDTRETAIQDLSKKIGTLHNFAPLLWNARGAIFALLEEIMSIYPLLSPTRLSTLASNRVCNALALLQCVASHPDTRIHFLNAHIPLYLYPFLNTSDQQEFEYLRLTSLGVIGSLVKVGDDEVITFLLSTEIVPLCLRSMEMGKVLSKTVATFIVQKILMHDVGLHYVCTTPCRVMAITRVFANMVHSLTDVNEESLRLLRCIVRCYFRLSEDDRACKILVTYLPNSLKDGTFNSLFHNDQAILGWLQQLLRNMSAVGRQLSLRAEGTFDPMISI